MILQADVPAFYSVAKQGVGLINGVHLQLTFDLAGSKVVGVHISPGVDVKQDTRAFWESIDDLLRLKR